MASKYLQKYPVPETFQEILHDFTREVLRDQPDDIVKYAAHYFECLSSGKPFEYQSKYNIPKGAGAKKTYQPQKASDITTQAKHVVDKSNNQGPTSIKRQPSEQSRPSSNKMNVSHTSSARESYADEKNITRQFMNDILPRAVNEVVNNEESDQEDPDADLNEEEEEHRVHLEKKIYADYSRTQQEHQSRNHQQENLTVPHQHPLNLGIHGKPTDTNQTWNCDECKSEFIPNVVLRWRCKECVYDMCVTCYKGMQDQNIEVNHLEVHHDEVHQEHSKENTLVHHDHVEAHHEHQEHVEVYHEHHHEHTEVHHEHTEVHNEHVEVHHEHHHEHTEVHHEHTEVHNEHTEVHEVHYEHTEVHHEHQKENTHIDGGHGGIPDQEEVQNQNGDVLLNAEDFNNEQIQKLVKIQSHVRGAQSRKEMESQKTKPEDVE